MDSVVGHPGGMPTLDERSWYRRFSNTPIRDLVRFTITGREDVEWILDASGLPDDSQKLLQKTISKSKLMATERFTLAAELVAEVKGAVAGGQSQAQAMAAYADWRAVAKEKRRQYKRDRPFSSWMVILASWWPVFLFALYLWIVLLMYDDPPRPGVDYGALINQDAAAVPEKDRAWPVIRDALTRLNRDAEYDSKDEQGRPVKMSLLHNAPTDPDWPRTAAYLELHADALARLRRAAAMPGLGYVAVKYHTPEDRAFFMPDDDPDAYQREADAYRAEMAGKFQPVRSLWLRHLSVLRSAARVLAADTVRAAQAGDSETAHANLIAIIQLGSHADEQNTMINQMVMLGLWHLCYETTSELLIDYPGLFTDKQLAEFFRRISALSSTRLDYTGEHLQIKDHIQRIYSDDGKGNGRMDFRGLFLYFNSLAFEPKDKFSGFEIKASSFFTPVSSAFLIDRKQTEAYFEAIFTELKDEQATPMWQEPESKADAELDRWREMRTFNQARHVVARLLSTSLRSRRKALQIHIAAVEATRVGIALERYRLVHGEYPAVIGALLPEYIKDVPIDHITGKQIRYKRIDGQPRLYSVGADRDDDGGRWPRASDGDVDRGSRSWAVEEGWTPPDGDWVVWPRHESAFATKGDR